MVYCVIVAFVFAWITRGFGIAVLFLGLVILCAVLWRVWERLRIRMGWESRKSLNRRIYRREKMQELYHYLMK